MAAAHAPGALVDLHCHWVAAIDDGARAFEASAAMLHGLAALGFTHAVATPHMRPGMFDNDRAALQTAYARTLDAVGALPLTTSLAAEHYLDDVVLGRALRDEILPYPPLADAPPAPGSLRPFLLELPPERFPVGLLGHVQRLQQRGLRVVLAHPERYRPVWEDDRCLDALLDADVHLLLDACAVVGKYGQQAERAARSLLDDGAYQAACSDAHRPADLDVLDRAQQELVRIVGAEEARRLFDQGPREILQGR